MENRSETSTGDLLAWIVQGYTAPRASMARVLDMRIDEASRLLMVGIGIAVSALGFALFGERPEGSAASAILAGYMLSIAGGLIQYRLVAAVVGIVSRAAGGQGSAQDNLTLTAWWMLVTAPVPLVMTVAIQNGDSPFATLILIATSVLSIVLLAAYIAETHKFHSTGRVFGSIFLILTLVGFVISNLIPTGPAPF